MQLILRRHELSSEVGLVPVRTGQTILQMLHEAAGTTAIVPVEVRVNGYPVTAEYWGRLRPKEGAIIHVTPQVLHGGSTRQILGAVAMIALTLAAPYAGAALSGAFFSGSVVAANLITAGIMIVGSLAIQALIPPPSTGAATGTDGQWHQLTGSRNQTNPWGPIPHVCGEAVYFPPHAALPYTETLGEANYQYCLFDLGYGDMAVSEIKIGDTPIEDFEDVEYELTTMPTLYRNDVSEEPVGAAIEHGDTTPVERTTAPDVESISLDIIYPAGHFGVGTSGKTFAMWTGWAIKYRLVGDSTWLDVPSPRRSGFTTPPVMPSVPGANQWVASTRKTPFGVSIAWDVPQGQYEVQVTRVDSLRGGSGNTYVDDATWTVMRSIKHTDPSSTGTNKLALRIRASDQLSGPLQTLSCMVTQKYPVYDRDTDTWSAPVASVNPAWVAWHEMIASGALSRHVPTGRMLLDAFADYAEFCELHELETRLVQDAGTTGREYINRILTASMASLGCRDGRYCPVFDHGETLPSMTFTPDEISGFRCSRAFNVLPHAFRVQFVNTQAQWQEDEIIVLADGYSYRGVDARGEASADPPATTFETLRIEQAMAPQQAWRTGRLHLAQAEFRPNTHTWSSDIAGLGVVRGDVVDVSHYVSEWGAGHGRVLSITAGGVAGAAATIVLDRPVTTEAAILYGVQFRHALGTTSVVNLVASGGETATFAIASLPDDLAEGDMAVIGERGMETAKLLVTDVRHQDELTCAFTAVEYDDRVAPYWADPPESIISEITGRDYGAPAAPILDGVVSSPDNDDADDAGIVGPVVRIGVRPPSHLVDERALA